MKEFLKRNPMLNNSECIPALRDDIITERTEEGFYIMIDPLNQGTYRLKEPEYHILRELNGKLSILDLLELMRKKYDYGINEESLTNFLITTLKLKLLCTRNHHSFVRDDKVKKGKNNSIYKQILVFKLDRLFDLFFKHWKYMITFPYIIVWFCVIGIGVYLTTAQFTNLHIFANLSLPKIVICIFFLYFTSIIHELTHGICCRYFNIEIDSIGIKLYHFIPVFFLKCKKMWILSLRKRLMIGLSGIYMEAFIYSTLLILNSYCLHSEFLRFLLVVLMIKIILNIIPFISGDGHFILSELLNIPNINKKTKKYIENVRNYNTINLADHKKIFIVIYGFIGFTFWLCLVIWIIKAIRI